MTELLIATGNKGKLRELKALLKGLDFRVTSLADYPDLPKIVEDGKTFRANAIKKAMTISKATGKFVMGEDSGLEVKALNNRPGIYSARFSGPGATDVKNNAKLLAELAATPQSRRQARYRCFIAVAKGEELLTVVNGCCGGVITECPRGTNGFGYDPLFLIPRYERTFGELDAEIKSRISHRARALCKLRAFLEK